MGRGDLGLGEQSEAGFSGFSVQILWLRAGLPQPPKIRMRGFVGSVPMLFGFRSWVAGYKTRVVLHLDGPVARGHEMKDN